MNPLIIDTEIELITPHSSGYWVNKIIDFDKWTEENYKKYHAAKRVNYDSKHTR